MTLFYYASWLDYLNNLLLHNYFFADTSYQLLGFYQEEDTLHSVVRQSYIKADKTTNLQQVSTFLKKNGFINTRRYDYEHPELYLILEDLHDENVLTHNELLYFIDTVFYVSSADFWHDE